MRINKFVALATGMSRRKADEAITRGRVNINDTVAKIGDIVDTNDRVTMDGTVISPPEEVVTVILNKPVGYVCSRDGQGSPTVYDLLPEQFATFKIAGRLDKDSSGLVLLSSSGELINELTHPKYRKTKIYKVELNKSLRPLHQKMINEQGVILEDGLSKFQISKGGDIYKIEMQEGRNRQIRRTFESLGYQVTSLHRIKLSEYTLGDLKTGKYKVY